MQRNNRPLGQGAQGETALGDGGPPTWALSMPPDVFHADTVGSLTAMAGRQANKRASALRPSFELPAGRYVSLERASRDCVYKATGPQGLFFGIRIIEISFVEKTTCPWRATRERPTKITPSRTYRAKKRAVENRACSFSAEFAPSSHLLASLQWRRCRTFRPLDGAQREVTPLVERSAKPRPIVSDDGTAFTSNAMLAGHASARSADTSLRAASRCRTAFVKASTAGGRGAPQRESLPQPRGCCARAEPVGQSAQWRPEPNAHER
ncbi:MAG: hypothetical protein JWM36_2267 [Hyphomicrobiales bacterium]|nr:hypothetical protein [Hyphomicrobiales bacterium]